MKILKNQRGGMTIMTLMTLSVVFLTLILATGLKLTETSHRLQQAKAVLNTDLAISDLAQMVLRARTLGYTIDTSSAASKITACPTGTYTGTYSTVRLCIPATDGDATQEVTDFEVERDNYTYGLASLTRISTASASNGTPALYTTAGTAAASTQMTDGTTLATRNNFEPWAPATTTWTENNEVFLPTCGTYSTNSDAGFRQYSLGCNYCDDPEVECWRLRMCPGVSGTGTGTVANTTCTDFIDQIVLIYFDPSATMP